MQNQLENWCEKHNAIERTEKSFWKHFDEFKKLMLGEYTKKQIDELKLFVENLDFQVHIDDKERLSYSVRLYAEIENDFVGNFKLTFDENGTEQSYEIW